MSEDAGLSEVDVVALMIGVIRTVGKTEVSLETLEAIQDNDRLSVVPDQEKGTLVFEVITVDE